MMNAGWLIAAALSLTQNQAAAGPDDHENPADLAVCAIAANALHGLLGRQESPDQGTQEVVAAVRDHAMMRLDGLDPAALEAAETEAVARMEAMRVGQAVEVVGDCALGFGLVSDDR